MTSSIITANNCYSTGAIGNSAGGILGGSTGYAMTSNSTITVNNCYSKG